MRLMRGMKKLTITILMILDTLVVLAILPNLFGNRLLRLVVLGFHVKVMIIISTQFVNIGNMVTWLLLQIIGVLPTL